MAERPPIRGARVAAGLSLRKLAALVEIDPVTLGEIERGLRPMTLEERARVYETICAAADAQQTRKGVDLGVRLLARLGPEHLCACRRAGAEQPPPLEECHRVGLCRMEGAWK